MTVSMLNITVIVYKCIELLFVHFVQFQQILSIYILYYILLYYIILYYIVLYYITLHYIILYIYSDYD